MEKIIGPYSDLDISLKYKDREIEDEVYIGGGAYGRVSVIETNEKEILCRKSTDYPLEFDELKDEYLALKKRFRKAKIPHLDFKIKGMSLYSSFLNQNNFVALSNNTITEDDNIIRIKYFDSDKEMKKFPDLKIYLKNQEVIKKLLFDMFDIAKKAFDNGIKFNINDIFFFIIDANKKEQTNIIPIIGDYDTIDLVGKKFDRIELYSKNMEVIKYSFNQLIEVIDSENAFDNGIDILNYYLYKIEWEDENMWKKTCKK